MSETINLTNEVFTAIQNMDEPAMRRNAEVLLDVVEMVDENDPHYADKSSAIPHLLMVSLFEYEHLNRTGFGHFALIAKQVAAERRKQKPALAFTYDVLSNFSIAAASATLMQKDLLATLLGALNLALTDSNPRTQSLAANIWERAVILDAGFDHEKIVVQANEVLKMTNGKHPLGKKAQALIEEFGSYTPGGFTPGR